MFKKALAAALLFLCFFLPAEALAGGELTPESVYGDEYESEIEGQDFLERSAARAVLAVPRFIVHVLKIKDPVELVYSEGGQFFHVFTEGQFYAVASIYDTIISVIPVPLVLAVVILGMMIIFQQVSSEGRTMVKSYILGIILFAVLMRLNVFLWQFVADINWMLVQIFKMPVADILGAHPDFLGIFFDERISSLGFALLSFIAVFSIGILNFQYVARVIVLALLFIVFPVVAVMAVFPQTRGAFGIYIKELVANVFLQASHALCFSFFFLLMFNVDSSVTLWVMFTFLISINAMAGLVRRVMGCESIGSSAFTNTVGAAMGIGGLFMLSRMFARGHFGQAGGAAAVNNGETAPGTAQGGAGLGSRIGSSLAKGAGMAGAAVGATALGLAAGSVTGNPAAGFGLGAVAGYGVTGGITGKIQDIVKNGTGIYHMGQLLSARGAARVGMNILGTPGAVIGGAAGGLAGFVSKATGLGKRAAGIGGGLNDYAGNALKMIADGSERLKELEPVMRQARLEMDIAKSEHPPGSQEYLLARENFFKTQADVARAKIKMLEGQEMLSKKSIQEEIERLSKEHDKPRFRGEP